MKKVCIALAGVLVWASPALAQNEAALREYFEGKTIVVKLDMPATSEGVDVFPDARQPIDFTRYAARLKSAGTALRSGESIIVTRIKIKDKNIEFHLGGGGFGTFGDDTSTYVYVPSTPKSNREKDLEREIKAQTDAARKRRMQRELDDLRRERAHEDRRNETIKAAAEEEKKQRIAQQRLHGGSRFNIRYQNGVPFGLTPDSIMRALSEYAEFPWAGAAVEPVRQQESPAPAPAELRRMMTGTRAIYKGMLRAEAEQILGQPENTSERMEGSLKVTRAIFSRDDQRITAEFVEGVLLRYSISSK